MTIIARIDEHACAAHGDCLDFAPQAFALQDTAVVIGSAPYETLLAAAQACPAVAISILDDSTGEQLFPYPNPPRSESGFTLAARLTTVRS